jgi:hypothetical protein
MNLNNYEDFEIFEAFRKLQKKGVYILFGEPTHQDGGLDYKTHACYAIPKVTFEMLEDKVITKEEFERSVFKTAKDLLDYWVESVEGPILVLRNLPSFSIEEDFITGIKKVGFRVRMIGSCKIPVKLQGQCAIQVELP